MAAVEMEKEMEVAVATLGLAVEVAAEAGAAAVVHRAPGGEGGIFDRSLESLLCGQRHRMMDEILIFARGVMGTVTVTVAVLVVASAGAAEVGRGDIATGTMLPRTK